MGPGEGRLGKVSGLKTVQKGEEKNVFFPKRTTSQKCSLKVKKDLRSRRIEVLLACKHRYGP